MDDRIPLMKLNTYQAGDGRRVEWYQLEYELVEVDDKTTLEDVDELISEFIGIAGVQTNMGVQEIRFPIEAKTLSASINNWESESFIVDEELIMEYTAFK